MWSTARTRRATPSALTTIPAGRAFGEKAKQYRCVALVTSASMRSSQQECIRGFREALADTPECYVQTFEKNSSIRAATVSMSIFSCYPQPEAVFVTNYGMAQSIRNVKECFFPERKVRIYTLSPIFTMPENDFVKYELNYRLLGKEAAQVLLEQVKTKQTAGIPRFPTTASGAGRPRRWGMRKA